MTKEELAKLKAQYKRFEPYDDDRIYAAVAYIKALEAYIAQLENENNFLEKAIAKYAELNEAKINTLKEIVTLAQR